MRAERNRCIHLQASRQIVSDEDHRDLSSELVYRPCELLGRGSICVKIGVASAIS
jgi:hypothetical protein